MAAEIDFPESVMEVQFDAIRAEFANGIIRAYSGTPADIESASVSSSTYLEFTESGETFTPGSPDSGVNMAVAADGEMTKSATEDWKATGLVAGSISWFRHYNNDLTKWIQGSVNTSGAALHVTTTAVSVGTPVSVVSYKFRY